MGTQSLGLDNRYLMIAIHPFFQIAMRKLIPMTVAYVAMFITGVLGNLAVCFVIVQNRTMHSATNYYLFSLAVSDVVILLLGKISILT